MRVSYNWLQELSREFIRTGTEVEAIDTVGESFDHVVTAKVVSKEPHPDSDHMWVTMVDVGGYNLGEDGSPEPLQIVCGAQNFEQGDHIVTALVGAELPGGIKIKKSKLRGVVSCGMNCSARELGLSGDHSGIMILPADAPVGVPFAEYRGTSDTVLDCEITPNRPDCLSMVGMAREVGAIFDRDTHVELPTIKQEVGRPTADEVSLAIADEGLCSRYVARIVRNVKVGHGRAPHQQHRGHHQLRDDAYRPAPARLRPRHLCRARRAPPRGGARGARGRGLPDARRR